MKLVDIVVCIRSVSSVPDSEKHTIFKNSRELYRNRIATARDANSKYLLYRARSENSGGVQNGSRNYDTHRARPPPPRAPVSALFAFGP